MVNETNDRKVEMEYSDLYIEVTQECIERLYNVVTHNKYNHEDLDLIETVNSLEDMNEWLIQDHENGLIELGYKNIYSERITECIDKVNNIRTNLVSK